MDVHSQNEYQTQRSSAQVNLQIKQLPHDLLAEKSLLGCLMVDGSSFDDISDLNLDKSDFFHPQYSILFSALKDLYSEGLPIDFVTISSRLRDKGKLSEIGGEKVILNMIEDQASAVNVFHYGKIVKDKSGIREIIKTAHSLIEAGHSHVGSADEFISDVEARFFKLTNDAKSGGMNKLSICLKENLQQLEDQNRQKGEISGIPTGYKAIDKLLLGMTPGQLIVLAARPAMGKSALAMNFALNCAEATGLPVAVFSLEMMKSELSMRLLSMKSKVESSRLKTKNLLDNDLRNIGNAVKVLSSLPIYINDSSYATVPEIQSLCRKVKAEEGLGMVIIDYLQLLRAHVYNPSREQQISEMSRALKNMAKELACPVIALSQLNRAVESRNDKRPMVSDLRESGSIEQDADIVMMIYRDEYYYKESTKEPGVAEVIIGKNRGGETGTAKLAFIGPYTSFENLAFDPHSGQ